MFWLLVISATLLYILYSWINMKPRNFPPGPPCLPFVGSAPFIPKQHIHLEMDKWRKRYGPMVGLMLGRQPSIAICEPSLAIEVLKRDEFQGRPDNAFLRARSFNKRLGIMFSDGPEWIEQRRFTLRHLRDFGYGKANMETLIVDEIEELMAELENKTVQVNGLFNVSAVNVLWGMMSGIRYKHNDPEFKELLHKLSELFRAGNVGGTNLTILFPILKHVAPNLIESNGSSITKQFQDFILNVIHEHKKVLDENNPKDFIDVYLSETLKYPEGNSSFTEENLVVICMDLFGAGADSVGGSLSFTLLYMVLFPEIQEKVQQEIDRCLGRTTLPTLQDRSRLPYTEAVLTEIQRSNSIAPMAVNHRVTRDTKLNGYNIPKDAPVYLSMWSLLQDKKQWIDATAFKPERFLDKSDKVVRDEWFIPFGLGKRVCPGEVFARNCIFLFFTSLLQRFTVTLPAGHPKPSTFPLPGFTIAPQPFEVTFIPR